MSKVFSNWKCAMEKKYPIFKKYSYILVFLLITGMTFILYFQYITCQKTYVFRDIAMDSYQQIYPKLYNILRYWEREGRVPEWSFKIGLGAPLGMETLGIFNAPLLLFGTKQLSFALGWLQTVKVVLAGMLFYGYLRTMKHSRYVSTFFAVCYAFSGHMIVRGSWASYANEVVCVAFLLLGFELLFMKKNIIVFPISVIFLFYNFTGYYIILYSLIIIAYAVFRFFTEDTNIGIYHKGYTFWFYFIICFAVGIGFMFPSIFRSISENINSSRFASGVGGMSEASKMNIMAITGFKELLTAYLRTISIDAIGISANYSGVENFLKDPVFYCGLLSLLAIPQAFCMAAKKNKIWYAAALGIAAVYMLSPFVRKLASGFSDTGYKISSFWIIILLIYLAAAGMEKIIHRKTINCQLLAMSVIFHLTAIIATLCFYKDYLEKRELCIIALLMLCYGIVLAGYKKLGRSMAGKTILMLLLIAEVIFISWGSVNHRETMEIDRDSGKTVYNDAAEALIKKVRASDKSFYRIDKQFFTVFLNDSQVQDYYGTQIYRGGTSNFGSLLRFTEAVQAPLYNDDPRCTMGYSGMNEINTLMAVKYILSNQSEISDYGYEFLEEMGGVRLYRNQYALPLSFAYQSYITEKEYLSLPILERRAVLLEACVISSEQESIIRGAGRPVYRGSENSEADILSPQENNIRYRRNVEELNRSGLEILSFEEDNIKGEIELEKDGILFLSIPYDRHWELYVDGEERKIELLNFNFIGTFLEAGKHEIELKYGK